MRVNKTPLDGFMLIEPDCFSDERGFFSEIYQEERYISVGITDKFVQSNHSRSVKGVLRGMHYQIKNPQAQIVTILRGKIFDVVVDLRNNSKTFGKWHGVELGDESPKRQVYMAPGFAHGFYVLSDYADLHYKVSELYDPDDEGGLRWNDGSVGIKWPVTTPIISSKDSANLFLKDVVTQY